MPAIRRTPILCAAAVSIAAAGALAAAAASGPAAYGSAAPSVTSGVTAASGPVADCLTQASPDCYSPQQFRTAYGIQPLTDRGITGRGETVVLPEVAAAPGQAGTNDVRQDLARLDSTFGLPPANLKVNTTLAPGAAPFQAPGEYFGDVEVVHEIAPRAALRVILLPPAAVRDHALAARDLSMAFRMAASAGSVISLSAAVNESCFTPAQVATMHSALQFDQARHVTVVVASGDFGAGGQPCTDTPTAARAVALPASDPLALGVGGTSLNASHTTGAYIGETAWNRPDPQLPHVAASTGGFSDVFARPAYQAGVSGIGAKRGVPDVSSDADLDTGIAVVVAADGEFAIFPGGGTSAGAPVWAGIVAMANQYAGRHLGFINPAIYRIGRGSQYHRAFHDITMGNNTIQYGPFTVQGFNATTGWDPVTGWGSPDAQVLIPLLARSITG